MIEIWKDIVGFEGLYQVSNIGNVKCLSRTQFVVDKRGRAYTRHKREVLLTPYDMQGYLGVTLYKDTQRCTKAIHKLVAEAFIPNPIHLPQVNHKDERKHNNSIDNLEWCSCSYNINYGTANQRRSTKLRLGGVLQ